MTNFKKLLLVTAFLLGSSAVAPLSFAVVATQLGNASATVIPSVGIARSGAALSKNATSDADRDRLTDLSFEGFKMLQPNDLVCVNPLTGNIELKGKDQLSSIRTKGTFDISGEANTLFAVSIETVTPKNFGGKVKADKKILGLSSDSDGQNPLLAALSTNNVQQFTGNKKDALEVDTELYCSKVLPKGNYFGTYSISIDYQ